MLAYAAAITPSTALAGWFWKKSVEEMLPPGPVSVHQWLGMSLAVLFLVLASWRFVFYRKEQTPTVGYFVLGFILLGALMYQGSLGGKMVFP